MTEPVWGAPLDPSDLAPRYANGATVAMSQWDLTVEFQQRQPVPDKPVSDPEWDLRSIARIVMSPTHAKVLAEILSNAVTGWEHRFGAMPSTQALLHGGEPEAQG
jgi:hypothetical protein